MRKAMFGAAIAAALVHSLAALAAEVAQVPAPMKQAVAEFAKVGGSQTRIAIGEPENPHAFSSGAVFNLPGWLGTAELTQHEASAVVAAVGAYAIDQHVYPQAKRKLGAADYLLGMTGAVASGVLTSLATNGQTYDYRDVPIQSGVSRTGYLYSDLRNDAWRGPHASSPKWDSPDDHFAALLVNLNSCSGAFASALAKLEGKHPGDRFTGFLGIVKRDTSVHMLRPDPHCGG
jgi:hypothetical protein